LLLVVCVICIDVHAQDTSKVAKTVSEEKTSLSKNSLEGHKSSLSFGFGTLGLAIDYRNKFANRFAYRIGGSLLPGIKGKDVSSTFTNKEDSTKLLLDVSLNSVHLLLEVNPFGGNGFRIITGLGFFNSAKGTLLTTKTKSLSVGMKKYSPDSVGTVTTQVDYGGVAPYLGIGLFRGVPMGRFNINLDLGTYFLPNPKVTTSGTYLFDSNTTESTGASLQKELIDKKWKFLPVLQLNLNFRL